MENAEKIRATGLIQCFSSLEDFQSSNEEGYFEIQAQHSLGRMECLTYRPCGDGERGDQINEPKDLVYPPLLIYRLNNVKLMMPYHFLWHQSGVRISDVALYHGAVPGHLSTEPTGHLSGNHCYITNNNYGNYFHWLTECLPAVVLGANYGLTVSRSILPSLPLEFQRSSAGAFDRECRNALQISSGVLTVGSLTFLSYTDHSREPHVAWPSELIPIVTKLKLVASKNSKTPRPRWIYVSRMKANRRRCLNEAVLEAELLKRDFQAIMLEDLAFEDQIVTFSEAELVVGLHGAGLTNLVFCKPGTLFVEVQPAGAVSSSFFRLAKSFDIRFSLFREASDPSAPPHSSWTLDVDKFLRFLAETLALAGLRENID
jgi:capsular polysaccharide biosynthesis protein